MVKWLYQLEEKANKSFLCFDITDFLSSISGEVLTKALSFTKLHSCILQEELEIIFHSQMLLLFNNGKTYVKKENNNLFEVIVGS